MSILSAGSWYSGLCMFVYEGAAGRRLRSRVEKLVRRLPALSGRPIRIQSQSGLKDEHGAVHASAFLRERRIAFDTELEVHPGEFARIFVHELFHFVWRRLGNPRRRSYEELVVRELRSRARGELGWSAERRKNTLSPRDRARRTRRWRDYLCESFCDTAAWMFAGFGRHPEFTLAARFRSRRRRWFTQAAVTKLSI